MELKKGMYVRINNDIRKICIGIGRIKQINQDTIYVEMDNKLPISFSKSEISKSSPNIIDLIKIGDYVNGYEVLRIDKECNLYPKTLKCQYPNNIDYFDIFNEDIKSILTKEQFSSMEYKIGDK